VEVPAGSKDGDPQGRGCPGPGKGIGVTGPVGLSQRVPGANRTLAGWKPAWSGILAASRIIKFCKGRSLP